MRIDIIKIGNSKGIRLPKAVLDQCGFRDQVELDVQDGEVRLRPVRRAREGWDEAFAKGVAAAGQEEDLMGGFANEFDRAEWEW